MLDVGRLNRTTLDLSAVAGVHHTSGQGSNGPRRQAGTVPPSKNPASDVLRHMMPYVSGERNGNLRFP